MKLKRRLFKPRWYPDELYNRWLSWLPLVGLIGLVLLVVVTGMHMVSPERAIASQCQMSAGKCYPDGPRTTFISGARSAVHVICTDTRTGLKVLCLQGELE